MSTQFYKGAWSWSTSTDKWLESKFRGLSVLNFPCGLSQVGTIRADVDKTVKPDILADVRYNPFRDGSFDVVICDPPFKMYSKFKWLLSIKSITRKYLLLSTPQLCYNFKGFKPKFYLSRKSNGIFIRTFILYTRKDVISTLDSYLKYKKLKDKNKAKTPGCPDPKLVKETHAK